MAQITLNSTGVASNGTLALQSNGTTTAVTIDASQNVGVGIAADERLTVSISNPTDGRVASLRNSGTSSLTGTKLWFNQNTVDNWNIGQPAGVNAFVFCNSTGSTNERMRIDSSGNVGIGTSSPSSYSFDSGVDLVVGDGTNSAVSIVSSTTGTGYLAFADGTSGTARYSGLLEYSHTSNFLGFRTSATEAMRIDSSGRLLVGTTSDWFNRKFVSEDATNAGVFISNSVAGASLDCLNTATSGNNVFMFFYTGARGAPSDKGSIDFNRSAGLVRYNTTSDATLKNIIGDSDGTKSSQILKSTRIREYSWKEDKDNKPQIGVIAQELYETFKGAVSVGGDRVTVDEEGNETTKYVSWAVDKTAFTFHLIAGWQAHEKSIQELKALVDTQASTITQLQADVAALKGTA